MRVWESIQFLAYPVPEKTLIIIPTYNESGNVAELLAQITKIVPGAEILVVDDNSPDGTGQVVRDFCQKNPPARVKLQVRDGERGLGRAYQAGLKYGLENDFAILLTMDSDFSHNPLHLPAMLQTIRDHDLVVGSRYIRDGGTINWRIRRILLSWLANRFARFLLGIKGADLTSGYRAYRRQILERIGLDRVKSNGYSYLVEMMYWAQKHQARVGEIPIVFYDRSMGESKISKKEIFRGFWTLLRLRFNLKGKK